MGLLEALGGLFQDDSDRANGNLNGLQRFGMSLDDPGSSITQNDLASLQKAKSDGVTDPLQVFGKLAQTNPQYTAQAAQMQAQNPLLSFGQKSSSSGTTGGGYDPNLTGDDLLKSLPPSYAAQVKAIAEGRQMVSPSMARSKSGLQMLNLVNQYDPNFDAVNYNARANTRKDFTSGKAAQNITSLNTAIGHISTLQDAANALDNTVSPTANGIINWAKNITGSGKVKDFDTAKDAVADEMTRVFRGTGGSVSDISAWKDKLNAANSPEQFKSVMGTMTELLNSRLDSLGEQYNQGMGTTKNGIELLSPKAQAAYAKITGSAPKETKVSGNMAADQVASSDQTAEQSASPSVTKTINGKTYIQKGGKWYSQ